MTPATVKIGFKCHVCGLVYDIDSRHIRQGVARIVNRKKCYRCRLVEQTGSHPRPRPPAEHGED